MVIQSITINQKIVYIIAIQNKECIILPYKYNLKYEFFPLLSLTVKIPCCKNDTISSLFVKDSFHILHKHDDEKDGSQTGTNAFHHYTFHPDSSKLELIAINKCKSGFIFTFSWVRMVQI